MTTETTTPYRTEPISIDEALNGASGLDLRDEILHYQGNPRNEGYPVECARVWFSGSMEAGYAVMFPRTGRVGVRHCGDACYTDAETIDEAIVRFLTDDMVN